VPDPAWKLRKYEKEWQTFDPVNATIGQGYFLVNPLQQAVMASRIAGGHNVMPRLIAGPNDRSAPSLGIPQDHLDYIHQAMSDVINGPGTAGRARLPISEVLRAGKTGTAQVVSLSVSSGKTGPWKYRDHGHFICFAPAHNPRYACSVVVEHGGGSGAAYPIARDVMTFLFDPGKALEALRELEEGWGGTSWQRLDAKYRAYADEYGTNVPKVSEKQQDAAVQQVDSAGTPDQPLVNDAQRPAPEPVATITPSAGGGGTPPPLIQVPPSAGQQP